MNVRKSQINDNSQAGPLQVLPSGGGRIVVPENATMIEKTAADELGAAIAKMGARADFDFLIRSDESLGEDGIEIKPTDEGVLLAGHPTRGPLYAVNEYLERYCGVRWWTTEESFYPTLAKLPRPEKPYRYTPPFRFRETFYRATLTDPDFKVRTKGNVTSCTRYIIPPTKEHFIPTEMGGNHRLVFFKGRRSAYHSFFQILPPDKYFHDHPEWYSLVKGVRAANGRDVGTGQNPVGQLCLTNEEMFRAYVEETKRLLRESPDCDSIQVTQNDWNRDWCECEKCKAVYEREGAVSGLYIDFANRVAAEVEKEFPNVYIDTFAYQFTRKAPKTVRPRRNVLVRLCDIECAFNRPLSDPAYEVNRTFRKDLEDWSRVAAGNLYIWDYQADFPSYMMPHPNLQNFAENMRLFRDAGAVGVFEQGDAMCPAGDFCALKCYVTSHLMWDPSLDWKGLVDEFLAGYYGPSAAPHLKNVLEIAEASATREGVEPMGCYHADPFPWITPEAGRAALAEMDAALAAAENDGSDCVRRVRYAKLSWDHARIRAWQEWNLEGDRARIISDWKRAINEFGIDSYRETTTRKSLDDYLENLK